MKVIILVVKSHSRRDGTEMCGHPVYHGSPTAPAEPSRAAPHQMRLHLLSAHGWQAAIQVYQAITSPGVQLQKP